MRKKTVLIFSITLTVIAGLIWYLFIKRWDYKVYFSVDAQPAVVYSFVRDWNDWNGMKLQKEKVSNTIKFPDKSIERVLTLKDTTLVFNWEFHLKNDSTTRVELGVTDTDRKLYNRLLVPFQTLPFEKSIKKNVLIMRNKLLEFTNDFKYEFVGQAKLDSVSCVYISAKTPIRNKAEEMIKNVINLNRFVKDNALGLNGNPMVVVKDWSPESDSISFDFCFPILHPELIPENSEMGLRNVGIKNALRADFYGNYSISDVSWNLLYEESLKRGNRNTGNIVEVFYNDPHGGGNELNWKAAIYFSVEK
ncbi:hypothetical protein [uncultured Draconibacterium sp.]|uniref:hypothetical protein n=1 Tax=uncultured Draconibacterium sp. TaxID=1573823 RepID=UPI0032180245